LDGPLARHGLGGGGSSPVSPKLTVCIVRGMYIRMKTRISISMEPEVHRRAKQAARRRGTTVSGLISSLVNAAVDDGGPLVDRLVGSAELRKPPHGSDPLHDALQKKYVRE